MKVTIPIEFLKNAINRCIKFTSPKGLVQEYSYFYFYGDSLRATDGFTGVVQGGFPSFDTEIMIPADLFSKPVQSLTQDVEISLKSGNIFVKSGGFQTKFPVVSLNMDRVRIESPDPTHIRHFPEDFIASIRQVYFSVCKDETKVGMRGVYLKNNSLYSTDNYRMAKYPLHVNSHSFYELKEEWIIPDILLTQILSEKDPGSYCIDNQKIWLYYVEDNFLVFGKFPTAPFPECESMFMIKAWEENERVKFSSSKVVDSLSRLSFFATAYPNRLDVIVLPNKLVFVVSEGEIEAVEEVACETIFTGTFPVNVNYFKEAMERSDRFYVTDHAIYFYSESGLESILLRLEVKSAENLLERFRSSSANRETEKSGTATEDQEKGREEE